MICNNSPSLLRRQPPLKSGGQGLASHIYGGGVFCKAKDGGGFLFCLEFFQHCCQFGICHIKIGNSIHIPGRWAAVEKFNNILIFRWGSF